MLLYNNIWLCSVCVACEPTPDCVEGPVSESIEWFIEDQTFLRPWDLAPRPTHSPLSYQQVFSLSQSSCVSPIQLADGRGGAGGDGGANSYAGEKAWSSINHLIPSVPYRERGMWGDYN